MTNPHSRRGESVREEAETVLRSLGIEFIHVETCKNPESLPQTVLQSRSDRVIVAGGDGSVKCVLEGLLGRGIPIGIIPAGTANNLSRTLGIPQDVRQACEVIARGRTSLIDLARVNGAYFVSVAGIGISTQVHSDVATKNKRFLGPLAYGLQAVRAIQRSRGFRFQIKTGDQLIKGHALQLTVCNGKHFGALLEIREDASVTDHKLDLLVIKKTRWFRGVLSVFFQNNSESVVRTTAERIEVRTWPPLSIDVEGDIIGQTPALFEILPNAAEVFVPEEMKKTA